MDYGDELIEAAKKRKIAEDSKIDENGNLLEKKEQKINYIIDQLVNHEEKFSNQEIREHLMVLLITASETSANYVATALVYLGIYQDIQQKVYDEIREVFHDDTVEVNWETVGRLKYLEMVMKGETKLLRCLNYRDIFQISIRNSPSLLTDSNFDSRDNRRRSRHWHWKASEKGSENLHLPLRRASKAGYLGR